MACEGLSVVLRTITATDWGHDLAYVMVSGRRTLYFCRRCGAYAETVTISTAYSLRPTVPARANSSDEAERGHAWAVAEEKPVARATHDLLESHSERSVSSLW